MNRRGQIFETVKIFLYFATLVVAVNGKCVEDNVDCALLIEPVSSLCPAPHPDMSSKLYLLKSVLHWLTIEMSDSLSNRNKSNKRTTANISTCKQ